MTDERFEALLNEHRSELLQHCFRLTTTTDDAHDLLGDTMLRLWRSRELFREGAGFKSWAFQTANRLRLDAVRAKGRRPITVQILELEDDHGTMIEVEFPDDAPSPEDLAITALEVKQATARVKRWLGKIAPVYAAAVRAELANEGETYKELAKRIGVNHGTFRSRRSRGMAALAKVVKNPHGNK